MVFRIRAPSGEDHVVVTDSRRTIGSSDRSRTLSSVLILSGLGLERYGAISWVRQRFSDTLGGIRPSTKKREGQASACHKRGFCTHLTQPKDIILRNLPN